ncbi:SMI1/KNR4 family protein [Massilia sp. B-10]|nr:SMI1/KNR4 family protein [Massilia sp. B-10]UUZ53466.1 SMI1/KNR4 family protein [Massilia sp. H-1]
MEQQGIERATDDIAAHLQQLASCANCSIGDEFAALYRNLRGGWLFDGDFRLMPIEEVGNVGQLQGGEFGRLSTPPSWVAFLDAMDSNYIAIDLLTNKILDCDHDVMGEASVIAHSLSDFFAHFFLAAPESYWLGVGFSPLETLVHPPSPELNRLAFQSFWDALGDEAGPETCSSSSCERRRIAYSLKCRKHHYDMVQGHSCPFE